MLRQQVGENCFAVLNEKNLVCDANAGLINPDGGVVIDSHSDRLHAAPDDQAVQQGLARHATARRPCPRGR